MFTLTHPRLSTLSTIGSMPEAEECLRQHLSTRFDFADWKPAFNTIFTAEKDTVAAITAIENLAKNATTPPTTSVSQSSPPAVVSLYNSHSGHHASLPQLDLLEADLMESIDTLYARKQIHRQRPTLEDLLDPMGENEDEDLPYQFPGGDNEIIEAARQAVMSTDEGNSNEDAETEDKDGDGAASEMSPWQGMELCKKLERLCLMHANVEGINALSLRQQLLHPSAYLLICHALVYHYVLPLSVPPARLATSTGLIGSCQDLDV